MKLVRRMKNISLFDYGVSAGVELIRGISLREGRSYVIGRLSSWLAISKLKMFAFKQYYYNFYVFGVIMKEFND